MPNELQLKEYEILSDDRRHAVQIFVQAVLVGAAVLGVAFTFLVAAKARSEAHVFGGLGLMLIAYFEIVA